MEHDTWKCVNKDPDGVGAMGMSQLYSEGVFMSSVVQMIHSCKADVWQSENGGLRWKNYAASPWKERWQHCAVIHDDRMFILGGWGGYFMNDVWSSPDGLYWIQRLLQPNGNPGCFIVRSVLVNIYI